MELALFRSPTLVEAAFLLRGPRALLLADAAFKMDASCGVPRGEIWQARLTDRPPTGPCLALCKTATGGRVAPSRAFLLGRVCAHAR